jgi:hypothetical protein
VYQTHYFSKFWFKCLESFFSWKVARIWKPFIIIIIIIIIVIIIIIIIIIIIMKTFLADESDVAGSSKDGCSADF